MKNTNAVTLVRKSQQPRRGAIAVLAAFLAVIMLGMVALSIDIGYLLSMKEETQRTADLAALATCWDYGFNLGQGNGSAESQTVARANAELFAYSNTIGACGPSIEINSGNSDSGDLVFGYINDPFNPNASFDTGTPEYFNAVRLRVRRDEKLNGEAPSFFAKMFGYDGHALAANATAVLIRDIRGFHAPSSGGNVDILPFALDLETWNDWMAETGDQISDNWTWDNEKKQVVPGSDGRYEVNLYPQGTGSPGNRGTVDIGSSNNSTRDIARQIVSGVSESDLDHHGGALEFDTDDQLTLNGDTGISAGVKDELMSIKGQPRIIPIFADVHGPGNNAEYRIVKWMGIRIVDVKLTGPMNKKRVTVQAAPIEVRGVIPSSAPGTSQYVFSPVALIN